METQAQAPAPAPASASAPTDWIEVEAEEETQEQEDVDVDVEAAAVPAVPQKQKPFVVMRDLFGGLRNVLTPVLSSQTRACDFEPQIVPTPFFVSTFAPYDHATITVHEIVRMAAIINAHCVWYFSPGTTLRTFTQPSATEFAKIPAALALQGFPTIPKTSQMELEEFEAALKTWPQTCADLTTKLWAHPLGMLSTMFVVCGPNRESRVLSDAIRVRFWPEFTLAWMVMQKEKFDAADPQRFVDVMNHFVDKVLLLDEWMSSVRQGTMETDHVPAYADRMRVMARTTDVPYQDHPTATTETENHAEVTEQLEADRETWEKMIQLEEAEGKAAEAAEAAAAAPTSST